MDKLRAKDLIEHLRSELADRDGEQLSYEALAAKLPISLSTLNRWLAQDTNTFRAVIAMLDAAGWLAINGAAKERVEEKKPPAEATQDPREEVVAHLGRLADEIRQLGEQVRVLPLRGERRRGMPRRH